MTRKSLILLLAVAALIVGGAFTVMAQDDGDNPTPFGPGWMHHQGDGGLRPGMMGRGFGSGMMWGDGEPMMLTVVEALGLEPDAFYAALGDGQTLAQIAEAQGIALENVHDVMLVQAQEHMVEMVDAGYITQEQADEHLAWMRENIAEMPMFSGSGFGFGMMGRGMRGHHS
ncbi:MAG: hypothetical protein K8L99_31705 [Anaerolineae bacterium]|nr:hypothetical protein [Anaerolineae bacterium]